MMITVRVVMIVRVIMIVAAAMRMRTAPRMIAEDRQVVPRKCALRTVQRHIKPAIRAAAQAAP